jgi:hypothetical protein
MTRPNDRYYEIKAYAFSYLSNTVLRDCGLIAMQEIMRQLSVRFGALTEEESGDVRQLLRNFGSEVERLADERRHLFDGKWRAYQLGYNDGKKSV